MPKADGEWLLLDWFEAGGPTVLPPANRGFGSVLLDRVLSPDSNGKITMDFAPAGLRARIEALLPTQPASG